MKYQTFILLAGAFLLSGRTFADASPPQTSTCFRISINRSMWEEWGFQYPVTYVFDVSFEHDVPMTVSWRDTGSDIWTVLAKQKVGDFYNGIECVKLDPRRKKAYVSIGFHAANTIHLKFIGSSSVVFDKVAKYYDARQAVYTLSDDNWGKLVTSHPGAPWKGMTNDSSDKYQAAVHACRHYHLPVTIAINSRAAGKTTQWERMQEELTNHRRDWEPAVHTLTHPCSRRAYLIHGYKSEILDCREDILRKLDGIPYGPHIFTFILPCAYKDTEVEKAAANEFLFLRDWNRHDNRSSTKYTTWNNEYQYYGIGGLQTVSYDAVLQSRHPPGRYYTSDVKQLDEAFDQVYKMGGIFHAMWHSDRYQNSVIHDLRPGKNGTTGSTLMQHFGHVANRTDVWYVANGWLYSYHYVAENVLVTPL